MQNRTTVAVLVLLVGVIVGWVAYAQFFPAQPVSPAVAAQFDWRFLDRGVDASISAPKTAVSLVVAGVAVPVGTYTGSCQKIDNTAWKLLSGEVSGVICWWAGGGTEVGIFNKNGKLVLMEGELDEGTAEQAGFRGNFKPAVKQPSF